MIKVNVKWGKSKFDDIEVDTSEPALLFKTQLFALTGVPVERMKVIVKGGPLKDDASMADLGLKQGQTLMMMGTADALPEPPTEVTTFIEDMPQAASVAELSAPAGLRNLGNTCYLNSSLQVLRAIPEVAASLRAYSPASASEPGAALLVAQRELLAELDRSTSAREVLPLRFVSAFRAHFPRFAEQAENGGYAQQDAEECWSAMIGTMASRLRLPSGPGASSNLEIQPAASEGVLQDNAADVLFGIQTTSTLTCAEAPSEPPIVQRETQRRLACHLKQGCAHLYNAIELSLEEKIEKLSSTLGREAVYTKTSKISRLPPYLPVQFVRFAWRADSQKRCKVLKEVSFPEQLDLRNLLAPSLAKRVHAHWKRLEKEATEGMGLSAGSAGEGAPASAGGSAMEVDGGAADAAAAEEAADEAEDMLPAAVRARDNLTGRYELFAVVTHEGRTAEGGHYVAWLKDDKAPPPASGGAGPGGTGKKEEAGWLVFDDETVARVGADKIKKLHGGGDYHMAYMCFYRASPAIEEEIKESARRSAGLAARLEAKQADGAKPK